MVLIMMLRSDRPARAPGLFLKVTLCGITVITLGGCTAVQVAASGATATATTAKGAPAGHQVLAFGLGPQTRYTVQAQPAAGSCHYRYEHGYPLPDPLCTPGALNPRVKTTTLKSTICRSGYTSTIRPSSSITSREKIASARSYGYQGSTRTGEYDHLISLELGGDPNDARNLWVEPNENRAAKSTSNAKDRVENAAHTAICAGKITLAAAQIGIATDWVALGQQLGLSLPPVK